MPARPAAGGPGGPGHARFVAEVAAQGARLAEVARTGPPDARVPHLLRWRLADVVAHLGGVHRWAAGIVASRQWDGRGHHRGRATGAALVDWYTEGLAGLVTTLAAADPAQPCPGFGPGRGTVGFWVRRQVHETAVHRWDAEAAAGCPTAIPADLAADGVDEALGVFRCRGTANTLAVPLALVAADAGRSWRVGPVPGAPGRLEHRAVDGVPGDAAAVVVAPAHDLLLCVWGRLATTAPGVRADGDPAAVRAFLPGPR